MDCHSALQWTVTFQLQTIPGVFGGQLFSCECTYVMQGKALISEVILSWSLQLSVISVQHMIVSLEAIHENRVC